MVLRVPANKGGHVVADAEMKRAHAGTSTARCACLRSFVYSAHAFLQQSSRQPWLVYPPGFPWCLLMCNSLPQNILKWMHFRVVVKKAVHMFVDGFRGSGYGPEEV